jgi:hypothetical protein
MIMVSSSAGCRVTSASPRHAMAAQLLGKEQVSRLATLKNFRIAHLISS